VYHDRLNHAAADVDDDDNDDGDDGDDDAVV